MLGDDVTDDITRYLTLMLLPARAQPAPLLRARGEQVLTIIEATLRLRAWTHRHLSCPRPRTPRHRRLGRPLHRSSRTRPQVTLT